MENKATIEQLAAETRREYQREWRRRNPDRVREMNRRYWLKRAKRMAAEKEAAHDGE